MSILNAADIEVCIQKLVSKFRDAPDFFYSESDMQCYLYHILYENPVLQRTYPTRDGFEMGLLHNEYRTYGKYMTEQKLLKKSEKGRRGHFDLVILDPDSVLREKLFRSKILFAVEMAFDNLSWVHFENDFTKLTDPRNKVAYGYILWFLTQEWPDSLRIEENGRKLLAQHLNIKWFYEKRI